MSYPLGTILLSRWRDERLNRTPGHWNHAAIVVSRTHIQESQRGKGVILTRLDHYYRRAIDYAPLIPSDRAVGRRAAEIATELVGRPYGPLSSARKKQGKRLNCVSSAFKRPYGEALGLRFRQVKWPDDILKTRVFQS